MNYLNIEYILDGVLKKLMIIKLIILISKLINKLIIKTDNYIYNFVMLINNRYYKYGYLTHDYINIITMYGHCYLTQSRHYYL